MAKKKKKDLVDLTDKELQTEAGSTGFFYGLLTLALLSIETNGIVGLIVGIIVALVVTAIIINTKTTKRDRLRKEKYNSILAETKSNVFEFDHSFNKQEVYILSAEKKVDKWAHALEARQQYAEKRLSDVGFVVSEELRQLESYRKELKESIIPKYEEVIASHKLSLQHIDTSKPIDGIIDITYNLDIPTSKQILMSMRIPIGVGMSNVQRQLSVGNTNSALLAVALTLIMSQINKKKAISTLTEAQGKIDNFMIEARGVISTLQSSSKHISSYSDILKRLTALLEEILPVQSKEEIEKLYIVGEKLKTILNKQIVTET